MKSGDRQKVTEREGTKGLRTGDPKNQTGNKKKAVKQLLAVNTKVGTSRGIRTWVIQMHIGSGGFGDVYKVIDERSNKSPAQEYAMKTEVHGAHQRRLNIEKSILKEIDAYTASNQKTRHFCELIDSGQTAEYSVNFSWIVMTLIGPSLDNVRRMLNKQFTKNCVINMALQILDAVEIMHEVGFIHRDLKPGNICTGNPPQDDHNLYILDFGISRRIFKNSKSREHRNKRERVPFYGTRKFCNRACHAEQDQGRKDDMETFVYTVLDLFHNERGLTWSKNLAEPRKIIEKKKAMFANPTKELDSIIPVQISKIIVYLNGLKFQDAVDYRYIEEELRAARKEASSSDPDESMDWTGKLEKMLKEAKKNKKQETPKGEETLMFERLQRARRARQMSSGGQSGNDSSMMRTVTKEGDGSEGPPGGFNERALTTVATTEGGRGRKEAPVKIGKKKSRSRH